MDCDSGFKEVKQKKKEAFHAFGLLWLVNLEFGRWFLIWPVVHNVDLRWGRARQTTAIDTDGLSLKS